jgi:transcriptional/translational regulatory protein YebC/TACO1
LVPVIDLEKVVERVKNAQIPVIEYKIVRKPFLQIELSKNGRGEFQNLIESLEDQDDVSNVFHNVKLS